MKWFTSPKSKRYNAWDVWINTFLEFMWVWLAVTVWLTVWWLAVWSYSLLEYAAMSWLWLIIWSPWYWAVNSLTYTVYKNAKKWKYKKLTRKITKKLKFKNTKKSRN